MLVIQADAYNNSRLATTIVATITSNTALAAMPGNVFLAADMAGLPKDSVANVTDLMTVNRSDLDAEPAGTVSKHVMDAVGTGSSGSWACQPPDNALARPA